MRHIIIAMAVAVLAVSCSNYKKYSRPPGGKG